VPVARTSMTYCPAPPRLTIVCIWAGKDFFDLFGEGEGLLQDGGDLSKFLSPGTSPCLGPSFEVHEVHKHTHAYAHAWLSRLAIGIACLGVPQIEVLGLGVERDPRLYELVPQLENSRGKTSACVWRPCVLQVGLQVLRNVRCTSRQTCVVLVGRLACVRKTARLCAESLNPKPA